ncbi:MAG: trypsin-like peptidase domain-containing protein [Pseudomonadota bacterium]
MMRMFAVGATVMALALTNEAKATDFSELFEKTDPAVAVIYTTERVPSAQTRSGEVASEGLGSGVLIDDEGHVMTAAHVVQTADFILVEFADGQKMTAAVVSSDPLKDVALLKLDGMPNRIKPAKLGDSDKVRIGDEVYVIGAPYGLTHTLTIGHISARHRYDGTMMDGVQAEVFQTDASINQGNSGGPMFNTRGEVVGIVSYIRSQSGGSEGLGFAVTSNASYEALFESRIIWSGMSGVMVSGALAQALNVPQDYGFLVQQVAARSPAERLGLKPSRLAAVVEGQPMHIGGDIILSVNGIPISPAMQQYRGKIRDMQTGPTVPLRILRGGEVIELQAPVAR